MCKSIEKPQKSSKIELLIQTSFNRLVCTRNPTKIEYHHVQSHRLHVWYIYIHLVDFRGKCIGKYTIHGSYQKCSLGWKPGIWKSELWTSFPLLLMSLGHKRTASSGELLPVSVDCHSRFGRIRNEIPWVWEFGDIFFFGGEGFIDMLIKFYNCIKSKCIQVLQYK